MKKIITDFFKSLKRPKLVKITHDPGTAFHVLEIEDNTTSLLVGLGMSDERAKYLETKCHNAFDDVDNIIAVIVKVSKECTHANELYFVSMVTTCIHKQRENPLGAIIAGALRGHHRPDEDK